MLNLFSHLDYRVSLRELLNERKGTPRELSHSELAEAMRVQPSYLSRILQKKTHANPDQLFLACQALSLTEEETDFILLLLEWARSDLSVRKDPLRKKIHALQEAKQGSDQVLKAEFLNPDVSAQVNEYYLDPIVPVIHVCLSIPDYQSRPELIAEFLGIDEIKLKETLELLMRLGIIEREEKKNRFRLLKDHIHLDRKSVLNQAYQMLFRLLSLEHLRRIGQSEKFQFAVTVSADDEARVAIHDEFNQFLKRIEAIVRAAPSKGVYQINFDLFRWDRRK